MVLDHALMETSVYDEILKYGLYIGAVFQLMCIAAIVFIPSKDEKKVRSAAY